MTLTAGEVAGVDHAYIGQILRRDAGILVRRRKAGADVHMNDAVIFLGQRLKTLAIGSDGHCSRAAQSAARCNVRKNIRRLNGHTIEIALIAHVDEQGKNLNIVLTDQFGGKVAGAVGSNLDSHLVSPSFSRFQSYYILPFLSSQGTNFGSFPQITSFLIVKARILLYTPLEVKRMTLIETYLDYLQQLSAGVREAPQGITLTQTEPLPRAAELQEQIQAMGVPEFVRRCAAQDGTELPQELFDDFREEDLRAALSALAGAAPEEEPDPEAQPPQIDEPDGPRSAYEVLVDCCCLNEDLLYYLIDVLKRGAEEEFQKLALVTARKAFTQADFLYWFATKQDRAPQEEMICVTIMDACLDRLAQEGQNELIAALLCGDRKTFELFRCDAPELLHLPQATYEWFEDNYLKGYYSIRYMLKFNKISFPKEAPQ